MLPEEFKSSNGEDQTVESLILEPLKVLAVDSEGWLSSAKIMQIHIQPMGNIYIRLSIPGKDLGCPDGGAGKPDGWLQLDTNATFFKE